MKRAIEEGFPIVEINRLAEALQYSILRVPHPRDLLACGQARGMAEREFGGVQ